VVVMNVDWDDWATSNISEGVTDWMQNNI
jgi:hypothetical protein